MYEFTYDANERLNDKLLVCIEQHVARKNIKYI